MRDENLRDGNLETKKCQKNICLTKKKSLHVCSVCSILTGEGYDALDSQCTDETRLRKNERTKIYVNEKEPDKKNAFTKKMNGRKYA